jgi:signal transduction histidine kinase
LILAPRSVGESFSPSDLKLINIIAQQAGLAAYTVRLNNDLKKSRERLVSAQEEERRRLRRDLHDGVGPTLASFSQRLETAAELIYTNPQKSEQIIHALQGQVSETVTDIRRLVYALRPPVLVSLDWSGSANTCTSGPMEVQSPSMSPNPCHPAAVEWLHIASPEAFTNIVKHGASVRF